jgi:ClpP class serine protease
VTEYVIDFQWDAEAQVWIATSADVPGLVLESGSFDALIERVRYAVPELLELNGIENKNLPLCIRSERHERMYA